MSEYQKLKCLQLLIHLLLPLGIYHIISSNEFYWIGVILLGHFFICNLGIICGYHRLLSHRSYKVNASVEKFLTLCGVYATMGSSIAWVGVHRLHHSKSDKDGDPHSPYRENKYNIKQAFKVWMNLWTLDHFSPKFVSDLLRDPFHKYIHIHYYKIILLTIIILFLINPWLVVYVYAIPACLSFHGMGSNATLTHYHGYRNHNTNDCSTNSWISTLITYGDGWHNNHHYNPSNFTTQEKWWEIDPAGWIIRLIKK
jgi:fatty-acid desaturase